jgi:thymidine kinase
VVTVISGPMFASKSKRLIQYLTGALTRKIPTVAITPGQDDRTHGGSIYSYDGSAFPACVLPEDIDDAQAKNLLDTLLPKERHVVALDEAQFVRGTILHHLVDRYLDDSSWLILSGLVEDSEGKNFGCLSDVLFNSRPGIHHEQLTARCSFCHGKATHTFCKVEKTGQILTGRDIYEPRCKPCWMFGREGKA